MSSEKIEKIKSITKKLKPQIPTQEPNKDYFDALMNQRHVKTDQAQTDQSELKTKENSLFDEVRELNQKVNYAIRSSPTELVEQTEDVIAQIDILKDKLETPDLQIKSSVQTLLKNKLSHIDESIKIAMENAGLEYKPPEKPTSLIKPMDRFLGLLTHSQSQLNTITQDIRTMAMDKQSLSPANMLLIQIKVNYIQREIELFSSMLNKALESTKTIMNVQV